MPMTERIFKQAYTVGMSNRLVAIFHLIIWKKAFKHK